MSKPKLSDFKKLLAELSHEELKAEMLKLFQKLPQVQDFYAQELLSETDRRKMLEEYKKNICKAILMIIFVTLQGVEII